MKWTHVLPVAFFAMCVGVTLGRGFGLWTWNTRRPADTDPPGSIAEKVFGVVSFIPVLALLVFGSIVLRGWFEQGYFPRDPFINNNNDIPDRVAPPGRYMVHWGTTIGFFMAALLSMVAYPGMITYLLSCRRPRCLGLAGPYVLGYVILIYLIVGDPGGLMAWLMD